MSKTPRRNRILAQKGLSNDAVDRENRIIRGFKVITVGEALGHGGWVDSEMVDQVVDIGNSKENGLKARFTHPGLSGDGIGKKLGRAFNYRRDGDSAIADLHLLSAETASSGPEGDLGLHVMNLAEETPQDFGASIVFMHDYGLEREFSGKHSDKEGRFQSPDKRNEKNYRHWRIAELSAVDVVDDPAANPDGFLHIGEEMADLAERALCFATGISEIDPGFLAPGLSSSRFKQFFTEFLDRRGLVLKEKETEMTEQKNAPERKPATLEQLTKSFPGESDFIISQLKAGATEEEAQKAFLGIERERLNAEKQALSAEREKLSAQVPAADKYGSRPRSQSLGVDPLDFQGGSDETDGLSFRESAKQLASDKGISITEAYQKLSKDRPELYAAYVGRKRSK